MFSAFRRIEQHMNEAPDKEAIACFNTQVLPLLPALYRTALMLTHHEQSAEDLVQETMLRAYRHIETFESGTRMKPWLMTILRRLHIDHYRRDKVRIEAGSLDSIGIDPADDRAVSDSAWDGIDPDELMEKVDDQTLGKALRSLPEQMRWALLLIDVEQLSLDEAAAILEVPIGTLKSRTSRGRSALRDLLEPVARERGWLA